MSVVSFRQDRRISSRHRNQLRAFVEDPKGDLRALVDDLGLRVDAEQLPYDIAAVLIRSPNCGSASGYRIAVNGRHSPERQRFSIAHEVGHFVLHRDDPDFVVATEDTAYGDVVPFLGDDATSYRDASLAVRGVARLEREANAFAAALLMPPRKVREIASYVGRDPTLLARALSVSRPAIEFRLRELRMS